MVITTLSKLLTSMPPIDAVSIEAGLNMKASAAVVKSLGELKEVSPWPSMMDEMMVIVDEASREVEATDEGNSIFRGKISGVGYTLPFAFLPDKKDIVETFTNFLEKGYPPVPDESAETFAVTTSKTMSRILAAVEALGTKSADTVIQNATDYASLMDAHEVAKHILAGRSLN